MQKVLFSPPDCSLHLKMFSSRGFHDAPCSWVSSCLSNCHFQSPLWAPQCVLGHNCCSLVPGAVPSHSTHRLKITFLQNPLRRATIVQISLLSFWQTTQMPTDVLQCAQFLIGQNQDPSPSHAFSPQTDLLLQYSPSTLLPKPET